ncbi:MAG: hypothetical protein L0Z50_31000 [Verrucomicrobiales bacterium]|nr:hypothetical protein [Verrucomicrobiales bacterium]
MRRPRRYIPTSTEDFVPKMSDRALDAAFAAVHAARLRRDPAALKAANEEVFRHGHALIRATFTRLARQRERLARRRGENFAWRFAKINARIDLAWPGRVIPPRPKDDSLDAVLEANRELLAAIERIPETAT